MSKRITQICFQDYRAFYGAAKPDENVNTFSMPNGENVLIYGENGSGKSSLYKGLKDFFESAAADDVPSPVPHILPEGNSLDASVVVTFDDGEVFILKEAATDTDRDGSYITEANKVKGFLSYKELLRTYLRGQYEEEIDFFFLLVTELLRNHNYTGTSRTIYDEYQQIQEEKEKLRERGIRISIPADDDFDSSGPKGVFLKRLMDFKATIETTLQDMQSVLQGLLDVFDQHLTVSMDHELLTASDQSLEGQKLNFSVRYYEHEIEDHPEFLNEARLSALAISIYLSALLTMPSDAEYKILFLDDIFIGLDTANRIPLLQILHGFKLGGEEQAVFRDYQVFITTYDRQWYLAAKRWTEVYDKERWKYFEMYVGGPEETGLGFDIPHIIPSKDYLLRAKDYLAKKDYGACGNYYRKVVEEKLKQFLPENWLSSINSNGDSKKKNMLKELLSAFFSFLEKLGLPKEQFLPLEIYKDTVLNPFSHDNVSSPVYKKELIAIGDVLEEMNTMERDLIAQSGVNLHLGMRDKEGIELKYVFELNANVHRVSVGGQTVITSAKCRVVRFEKGSEVQDLSEMAYKPERLEKVYRDTFKHHQVNPTKGYKEGFTLDDGRTWQAVIEE